MSTSSLHIGTGSRVLVTGGFGFLGSHILELVLARDCERVHVVDNLSSNPVDLEVLLEELPNRDKLTYDLATVAEFMREGPDDFEAVIHLASVGGPAGVLK